MSAKIEDLPQFSVCKNKVVEFESTWSLERVYDKAIPIPTQTDPINKMEHKSTNVQEYKDDETQTESFANTAPAAINEKKLTESLRLLSAIMESEVKLGTTNIFKFQSN
ncbi:uncharacterized protein LOC116341412 [Contarinia nasturtii]|uniref:uncharacterized protein LOC116341412 n=1 Tax=Contarinia nasturtii TaxID=265458 RepID=UPI0012D48D88|nr:uncharacterized protein LOC116341412 [Contarinia nasturtii]